MKQFNLNEYLRLKEEGKEPKIVTRDGHSARIVCTDRKNPDDRPIIALVGYPSEEYPVMLTKEGRFSKETEMSEDILFAPIRHKGWINIYREANGVRHNSGLFYDTELRAIAAAGEDKYYVATAKVEWEE